MNTRDLTPLMNVFLGDNILDLDYILHGLIEFGRARSWMEQSTWFKKQRDINKSTIINAPELLNICK